MRSSRAIFICCSIWRNSSRTMSSGRLSSGRSTGVTVQDRCRRECRPPPAPGRARCSCIAGAGVGDGGIEQPGVGQQLAEGEPGHVLAARFEQVFGGGIHVVDGELPVHQHHGCRQQIETVERCGWSWSRVRTCIRARTGPSRGRAAAADEPWLLRRRQLAPQAGDVVLVQLDLLLVGLEAVEDALVVALAAQTHGILRSPAPSAPGRAASPRWRAPARVSCGDPCRAGAGCRRRPWETWAAWASPLRRPSRPGAWAPAPCWDGDDEELAALGFGLDVGEALVAVRIHAFVDVRAQRAGARPQEEPDQEKSHGRLPAHVPTTHIVARRLTRCCRDVRAKSMSYK